MPPIQPRSDDGTFTSGHQKYFWPCIDEVGKAVSCNGFWSLNMYDAGYFFVANPLNRYTLSARNKLEEERRRVGRPVPEHENPGKDKESNWLPAPADQVRVDAADVPLQGDSPRCWTGTWTIPGAKSGPLRDQHFPLRGGLSDSATTRSQCRDA